MSMVDITIIAIVAVSLLVGLFRGFIREVLSLASWTVALWIAYTNAVFGATFLEPYIDQPPFRVVVAFAGIFIVVLIAASILSYLLYRLLSISGVTGIDRSLGLLFGIVRGVIIVAILILVAVFMDLAAQPWWQESMLVNYFSPVTDMLRSLMPEELAIYFDPKAGIG